MRGDRVSRTPIWSFEHAIPFPGVPDIGPVHPHLEKHCRTGAEGLGKEAAHGRQDGQDQRRAALEPARGIAVADADRRRGPGMRLARRRGGVRPLGPDRRVLERDEGAGGMRRKAVRQRRECLLPRAAVVPRDLRRAPGRVAAVGAVAGERPAAGTVDRAGIKPCLAPRRRGNAIPAGEWGRIPDLHSSAVSSSLVELRMIRNPPCPQGRAGPSRLPGKARTAWKGRIRPPGQAAECPILSRNDPAAPDIAERAIRRKTRHSGQGNAGFKYARQAR